MKQGTNLNQIAARTNRGDYRCLDELPAWFEASHALMSRIADALAVEPNP